MRVLFWNVGGAGGAPAEEILERHGASLDVDAVLLAEHKGDLTGLAARLSAAWGPLRAANHYTREKVRVLFRSDRVEWHDLPSQRRYRMGWMRPIGTDQKLLTMGVHLQDRISAPDELTRAREAEFAVTDLRIQEAAVFGDDRPQSLILGDFNMHPWESGVIGIYAFHALHSRKEARRRSRTYQGREYPMRHNLSWPRLAHPYRPGTLRYSGGPFEPISSCLDQAIVSPDLIDAAVGPGYNVLESIGDARLLNSAGNPNRKISDHLPILVELDLERT